MPLWPGGVNNGHPILITADAVHLVKLRKALIKTPAKRESPESPGQPIRAYMSCLVPAAGYGAFAGRLLPTEQMGQMVLKAARRAKRIAPLVEAKCAT